MAESTHDWSLLTTDLWKEIFLEAGPTYSMALFSTSKQMYEAYQNLMASRTAALIWFLLCQKYQLCPPPLHVGFSSPNWKSLFKTVGEDDVDTIELPDGFTVRRKKEKKNQQKR